MEQSALNVGSIVDDDAFVVGRRFFGRPYPSPAASCMRSASSKFEKKLPPGRSPASSPSGSFFGAQSGDLDHSIDLWNFHETERVETN